MTRRGILTAALLLAWAGTARAQEADTLGVPLPLVPPDSRALTDSLFTLPLDTTAAVGFPGPVTVQPAGAANGEGLEEPITFSATDSLVIVFASERPDADSDGDLGTLFGAAEVGYEDATLTAAEIDLLFGREELRARGPSGSETATDSLGEAVGTPQFQRGDEGFSGRELAYNLGSRRGRVVGARTAIEDGYLLGGVVKQAGPHVVFAKDATYTTCELDHPHYGLRAGEMKIVDGKWVYTGPARLYLLGIPTPLWLPFGFFPAAEGRRSGPLPPSYGEDPQLGFYLRDLGWYWAISDYMDLQVRGGLWTKGSFEISPRYRYAKRYVFSGGLDLAYSQLRRGEGQDPNATKQQNARVGWQHQQQLWGNTASLNASVNLASTGYLRAVSNDFDDRVTQTTQSSVRFTKSWRRAGRSLSADLRQSQNLTTGTADLTLPNLSFSQSQRFPLRRAGASAQSQRWYERIGYAYSGTLQNTYDFTPRNDTLLTEDERGISWLDGIFDYDAFVAATGRTARFTSNVSHSVPVNASFALTRLPFTSVPFTLNLTPNARYEEDWYPRSTRVLTDADGRAVPDSLGRIQQVQEDGFTAVRQISGGVRANSEFFGTFPLRLGPLDGLRHIVRPSLGYTFSPDYSKGPFNYFRSYVNAAGETVEYPIVSGISNRERQALSFDLSNTFQTRIARTDSTGEVQRRAVQLLTLSLASNYDLAADSLRLAPVSLTANSRLGQLVTMNLTALYSPYALGADNRQTNRLQLEETGGLLRFLSLSFAASTSFRGSPRRGVTPLAPRRRVPVYPDLVAADGSGLLPYDYRRRDLAYVDFAIPWSLSLDFNYRDTAVPGRSNQVAATLGTRFDLSLTSNWKIAGRSGYDLEAKEITTTQLSVLRDLHCWEMSFNWIPFGDFKSFGFSIYVKSGQLADLLRFDVPKQDVRRRLELAGGF